MNPAPPDLADAYRRLMSDEPPGHLRIRGENREVDRAVDNFLSPGYAYDDFYAHLPSHKYLHVPTAELWPAASVNAKLQPMKVGGDRYIKASGWLDKHRAVMQIVWMPGEPELIKGRVMQAAGWKPHAGAQVFNLYLPPSPISGDATKAGVWLGHLERLYPADWRYIVDWFAYTAQRPADKINCALVLGGSPGLGKDTLIEPLRAAVGAHNVADITPPIMFGRFNRWVRNKLVRVSEVRDLGEYDRFAFYEHTKPYLASPPDVIRIDEKNLREYYIANVCSVIYTTNHITDGLYLPADDRRHYVAWSTCKSADFGKQYFGKLWTWYAEGGMANVVAFLREHDLSNFDPKAPPPKTPAFWQVVAAGESPESGEMRDVIERLGNPPALTIGNVTDEAEAAKMFGLHDELSLRANRRSIPHRMERAGYSSVRNPNAEDGLWKVAARRTVIYARSSLTLAQRITAANRHVDGNGVIPKGEPQPPPDQSSQ